MLSKSSDFISLSLTDEELKVVHVKGSGRSAKVINVLAQDIRGVPPMDVPKMVVSAVGKGKLRSANILYVVPPNMATTKNIDIPSTNPDEIRSIVNLQAGRHTPFSRDEIQPGYISIGIHNANFTKVLLVIANKSVFRQQINILDSAGIKIRKVLFAPEGIAQVYTNALKLKSDNAPTGIIDIGRTSTDFVIVFKGLPITTRNIPFGRLQLKKDGPAVLDKLIDELRQTLESYQSEDIEQAPFRYIITSNDEYAQLLGGQLAQRFSWDVKMNAYVDIIKTSGGVVKKIARDYPDVSFLALAAAGACARTSQVDLMPDEFEIQKSVEMQGREVFRAMIAGFIFIILVGATIASKLYFTNAYLNNLTDHYKDKRQEVDDLERISDRTRLIRSYLESRMVSLEVINELYKNIPREIYLTNILMDKEGNITIQGISEIDSLIFKLVTSLKNSELFKSVNVVSTNGKKDRGKDVSAFEIALKLKSADDDKIAEEVKTESE